LSWNRYAYCGGNPVNYKDLNGLRMSGHHIISENNVWAAIFGNDSRMMELWNQTCDTEDAVVGLKFLEKEMRHNYFAHPIYNEKVTGIINDYMNSLNIDKFKINESHVKEILQLLKNSRDPFISGFNNAIE
jgi:hypothetical protein